MQPVSRLAMLPEGSTLGLEPSHLYWATSAAVRL